LQQVEVAFSKKQLFVN